MAHKITRPQRRDDLSPLLVIDPATGQLLGPDPVTGHPRHEKKLYFDSVGDAILRALGGRRAVMDVKGPNLQAIRKACNAGYPIEIGGRVHLFKARFATSGLKKGQLTLVSAWDDRYIPDYRKSIYSGSLFSPARYGVELREVVLTAHNDDTPDFGDGQAVFENAGLEFQTQFRLAFDPLTWADPAIERPIVKGTALGADFLSITRDSTLGGKEEGVD